MVRGVARLVERAADFLPAFLAAVRPDFFLLDARDLVLAVLPDFFFVDLRRFLVDAPAVFLAFFLPVDEARALVDLRVVPRDFFAWRLAVFLLAFFFFLLVVFFFADFLVFDEPPPKMFDQFSENFSVDPTRKTLIPFWLLSLERSVTSGDHHCL